MASDAGDDTGRMVEQGLERFGTNIALGRVREVTRDVVGRHAPGADAKAQTTTFLEVPLDDTRERDLVADALRSRGVECEAVDGATGEPCVVIAERDRGQAIDAAGDAILALRERREDRASAFDLAEECREMRDVAREASGADLQRAVSLEEHTR